MTALLDAPDYGLTRRERDVSRLLLGGLGDKSIARLLTIETQQVRRHMSHILTKTHSINRTAAALKLAGFVAAPCHTQPLPTLPSRSEPDPT